MKATVFIRIAAVLVLIHAVLHTVGGVFGKIDSGPAAVAVEAMKANQFLAFGKVRTFWDFYRGLGLGVTIFLTIESPVLWLPGYACVSIPRAKLRFATVTVLEALLSALKIRLGGIDPCLRTASFDATRFCNRPNDRVRGLPR